MPVNKECEHVGCNCAVGDDSDYCSPYCETAGDTDTVEIACECHHAGCPGSAIV